MFASQNSRCYTSFILVRTDRESLYQVDNMNVHIFLPLSYLPLVLIVRSGATLVFIDPFHDQMKCYISMTDFQSVFFKEHGLWTVY
jgi:hypothetical protein